MCKKIGIFLPDKYFICKNVCFSYSPNILFLHKLSERLGKKIVLMVPVKKIKKIPENKKPVFFCNHSVELIKLPYAKTLFYLTFKFLLLFPIFIYKTLKFLKKTEITWIRLPSPIGYLTVFLAKMLNIPIIIHIAGDIRNIWKTGKHPLIFRPLIKFGALFFNFIQKFLTRNNLTLITGKEIYDYYIKTSKRCYEFIDILLSKNDIVREDNKIYKKYENKKEFIVCFVGRLDHGKGVEGLIEVIKIMHKKYPLLKLKIIGDGPLRDYVKKEAKMNDFIEWKGFIPFGPDLLKEYRTSHVFVFPTDSYPEGFPRVIIEALSQGVPVIASKIASVRYLLQNNYNALLFAPKDFKNLKNLIERLILNPKLVKNLIKNGLNITCKFTLENQLENIIHLISKVYPKVTSLPSKALSLDMG